MRTPRPATTTLLLAATIGLPIGCARPPASAYAVQATGPAADAVALGSNASSEPCLQREVDAGRSYSIACGTWNQPSALLQRGAAATAAGLQGLATTGPWRQQLDTRLACDTPAPATILGSPALLLRCSRRVEGFPQTAFVVVVDGRAWFADGVPGASLVMERALALDTGRIAHGSLGTVTESPGLAAERLATRAVSSNDMAHYQDLQRTAVRANLAGEYASAETAYRAMTTLQRRVLARDNPSLARAMALQALQISNQGRYPEATAMLAQAEALAVRANGEDDTALAQVWHYEALNLLNQDQPRDALRLLHRAESGYLVLAPDSEDRDSGPGVSRNAQAGDLIPTDPSTRAAAFGVAETRRGQAVAWRMLGDQQRSTAEAHAAARVLTAYGLSNLKASARISRTEAMVLQASSHSSASLDELQAATDSFGKALPGTRAYGQTQLLLAARLAQDGQAAAAAGACRTAERVLRGAGAGVEPELLQPCLAQLAPAAEAGDQAVAREMFLIAQQAQGGTTSQQIALVSARLAEGARDPRVAKLIRERDDANALLAQLYASAGGDTASKAKADTTASQIADTEHRRDGLEQALQSASPNYGQLVQQAVSTETILAALRPHEAFASIVLSRTAGYNFIFHDSLLSVVAIPGGASRVDPLVARIRSSMDARADALLPFDTAAASELYAALFGSGAASIGQATTLTVAPSGTLLSIPFGLLLTAPGDPAHLADAPWLIRRVVVAHVPAAANFVSLRHVAGTSRATKPWFGFGEFQPVTAAQAQASFPPANCHDSAALFANLQRLPGARVELALAATQLGANQADELLGPHFTAAGVQARQLKDYHLLHFATHAILQTDLACQAEPALVTSAPAGAPDAQGALLTASQIAGMKLDADAVLLSACNTGGPGGSAPGESLSGLARSFFYAGARSLLVTHWDVNDKVTAVLVSATLANLHADPSLGMAAALAGAQRRLLDRAGGGGGLANLAHPFFWAPLALIGEGRSVVELAGGLPRG